MVKVTLTNNMTNFYEYNQSGDFVFFVIRSNKLSQATDKVNGNTVFYEFLNAVQGSEFTSPHISKMVLHFYLLCVC